MTAIDAGSGPLHVDRFGLSIGAVSVGLPTACTADVVLLRYLDLVQLAGTGAEAALSAPRDHIQALAEAVRLDTSVVHERLLRLAG